ncbi:unnamed protein product [Paramecium pentaurelia]|uniref:Uncharacterized protein n=1 Tax=Paramecium pentaurelia TaxID=43138 RepID=A0A8S1TDD2_9CILI|nr:unnamed protein product [Paramecium pentaurelia]
MQSTFDLKFNLLQFKVLQLNVKWHAINDQRIQVINNFNRNDPKNETIIYNNPNALTGFLTLTSISFEIQINFKIEIIRHIKYQQFEANRLSNHFRYT